MLLGGKAEIDIEDIKKISQYTGGYDATSPQVEWFWKFVDETDQEILIKILSFTTGCAFIPVDGLNPAFTLVRALGVGVDGVENPSEEAINNLNHSLPRSHTCFNQLVLPAYASYEILVERLLYALSNTGSGFFIE
jgi:hypothetical protein